MNNRELLPIGSVVLLKNGTKKVMIYGVKQTDVESGTEYDYISVLYPEGNMGEEAGSFLFNHSDIEEIYFQGYEDEERETFLENLAQYYENQGKE